MVNNKNDREYLELMVGQLKKDFNRSMEDFVDGCTDADWEARFEVLVQELSRFRGSINIGADFERRMCDEN